MNWWSNSIKRDYLTFSEILQKFRSDRCQEEELSSDFLKLCKEVDNNPSEQMFEFMHNNLPSAKNFIIQNNPGICVNYFKWRKNINVIEEINNCILNEYKNVPYNQIIFDILDNSSTDVSKIKKIIKIYEELYNKPWFNVNEEIISNWGFDGECKYIINNFPSYIIKREQKYLSSNKEYDKYFFELKYKKIRETMKIRRKIGLDWNIKKLLIIAIRKDQNNDCNMSKVPKDIIKVLIAFCDEKLEQPNTNFTHKIIKDLKLFYE